MVKNQMLSVIATPINTHHSIARRLWNWELIPYVKKILASTIPMGKQMVQMAMDHPELCAAWGLNIGLNRRIRRQMLFTRDPITRLAS